MSREGEAGIVLAARELVGGRDLVVLDVDDGDLALLLHVDEDVSGAVGGREFQLAAADRDGGHGLAGHRVDLGHVAAVVVGDEHVLGERIVDRAVRRLPARHVGHDLVGRGVDDADGLGRRPQRHHAERRPRHHHHHVAAAGAGELRDLAGLDVDHVGAVAARAVDAAMVLVGHDIVPAAVGHLDPVDDLVARIGGQRRRRDGGAEA